MLGKAAAINFAFNIVFGFSASNQRIMLAIFRAKISHVLQKIKPMFDENTSDGSTK